MGFRSMDFDDFAKELEELGNVDDYASAMLQAAAPVLQKALKGRVKKEANRGYATGDLEGAIEAHKPGKNGYGHYVMVTADGVDRKGVRNNEKLAYLNYGTSKQQARPVIARAIDEAEPECLKAMQEKFDEVAGT